jgi:tetratricopeptide (TPR) repeat protein
MLQKISTFIFLLIVFTAAGSAQWLDNPAAEAHIHKGINNVYSMAFDSARAEFREVIKINPEHPAGHFFLAMVEWWNIMIDLDNQSHDAKFIAMLDKVIDLCDKRLDKNDDDVVALFFKGGSIGFRGRLYANRSDWIKAANDGRTALPLVQKMYKLAPNNYDVLLGIGIYNYYAAIVPEQYPMVKPLMLFFPEGDKLKGIVQLQQTSEKGLYAKYEAAYFLLQLYQMYEKRYTEALALATDLHKKFPANPIFYRYLGKANVSLSNWDEFNRIYTDILERTKKKEFGFNAGMEREAEYYLGLYQMNKGRFDDALPHFYRCDELCRLLDKETASGFMAMANLKVGMIYDKQSKRDLAIEQYKKVLQYADYLESHKFAEQYLKAPYGK